MKITVLVENTAVSPLYKAKHGLCLYIETAGHKILFDLGPGNVLIKNAASLGIDLTGIDTVIISHGHHDHGGALKLFLEVNDKARIYVNEKAFEEYYAKILGVPVYIGLDVSLRDHPRITLVKDHHNIDKGLFLFSGIHERRFYSRSNHALFIKRNGRLVHDNFNHEQNLVIMENDNCVLVGGCAHNGIVNIQNAAEVILQKRLTHVISGFHLFNPASKKTEKDKIVLGIARELQNNDTEYFTCHCTGKKAFKKIKDTLGEKARYISTGQQFEI